MVGNSGEFRRGRQRGKVQEWWSIVESLGGSREEFKGGSLKM